MHRVLGIAAVAALTFASVPASQAADVSKMQGKWSTWGCNVNWFDLGADKIAYYSTQQKLPDNLVSAHDAKISENGGKLHVEYNYRGSDYKYVYGIKGDNALLLDQLLVDNNVEFDRTKSGSPHRDRETQRCSPSA